MLVSSEKQLEATDLCAPVYSAALACGSYTLSLETSLFCNMKCAHCYCAAGPERDRGSSIPWSSYVRRGKELGFENIQFVGGEPMLFPEFRSLLFLAKQCEYQQIEIFSNLTVVPEGILPLLISSQEVLLSTWVYAMPPSIHDRLTGKKRSQEATLSNIARLCEPGIRVKVHMLGLSNRNTSTSMVQALYRMGVCSVVSTNVWGFGRGARLTHKKKPCGACHTRLLRVTYDERIHTCGLGDGPSHGQGFQAFERTSTALMATGSKAKA